MHQNLNKDNIDKQFENIKRILDSIEIYIRK